MEPANSGKVGTDASGIDGNDSGRTDESAGAGTATDAGRTDESAGAGTAALGTDPRSGSSGASSAPGNQEKSFAPDTSRLTAERKPKRVPIQPDDSETRKGTGKLPTNTNDLLQDAITGLYWIPAYATGIKEWELQDEEAATLADRVEAVLKSGDKKRAARIQKFVENVLPSISLVVAAAIITAPRIRLTQERRNHGFNSANAGEQARRSETVAPDNNSATRGDNGTASAGRAGEGRGELRAVALTSADLDEFRSRDVGADG